MPDYILLMHSDTTQPSDDAAWGAYLAGLQAQGVFQGGSEIGAGTCVRKAGAVPEVSAHLSGFIRVTASDLAHAKRLVVGNPVYEAGGTVEVRELPVTG